MQRTDSLVKTLMLGKIKGRRRSRWQKMRWLDGIIDSMDMNLSTVQEILKDREVWHAAVHGIAESDTTKWLHFQFSLSCIGERNGNPLQYSCLENPRDRGAWWAAVYGVTQSRTRLKWLSSSRITLCDSAYFDAGGWVTKCWNSFTKTQHLKFQECFWLSFLRSLSIRHNVCPPNPAFICWRLNP